MRNGALVILIGVLIVYLATTGRMSQIVRIIRGQGAAVAGAR